MISDDPAIHPRSPRVAADAVVRRHAPPGVATVESARCRRLPVLVAVLAVSLLVPATAGADTRADGNAFPGLQKRLISESRAHLAFTRAFLVDAAAYDRLAAANGYDYARLWKQKPGAVRKLLTRLKREWVVGNPLYERMEGIVAGVPSLRKYDVDIDAGTSFREDPASAVSFSLKLSDGRTVRQPGAYYNITEAALWGEDRAHVVSRVKPDLDGDGKVGEFGEVLPDARFLVAAARSWEHAGESLLADATAYRPTTADAFTALVVMVPTMNEYFGQWKESRFVTGGSSNGTVFNVVSRLSDVHDILGSLTIVYADLKPRIAKVDADQAAQTGQELKGLSAFIERLYRREQAGSRFTKQQAELLGKEAQERATKVAGQVSQAAARLDIKVEE